MNKTLEVVDVVLAILKIILIFGLALAILRGG